MTSPRREPNIARRTAWVALAYVLMTGGLLVALLLQLRAEAIAAGRKELGAFAQLTAEHTIEVVSGIEDALKLAAVTLSIAAESSAADEESIRPMLRDVVRGARGLKDVFVLDARGRVVYQASGRDGIGLDRSDRPYFAQYRKNTALQFDVGTPVIGTPTASGPQTGPDAWFIPVTQAWRSTKGEFSGVVVGMLDPQLFDKAWTFDSEIPGLSIALTAPDSTLIMRRPFAAERMGRRLADDATRAQLAADRTASTVEGRSAIDGEQRLIAFRRVAGYPELLTFVAQPMNVVLADWWRLVWISASCWIAASLALGGLGAWLAREMKARGTLESRYRALFDSIPYPVIVSDNGTLAVLAVNEAAERQYGLTASREGYLPEDFAVLAARRQDFSRETATVIRDQRHRDRAGNPIDVEMAVRLIDYDGRPAALTVAVDVSDRLQAERGRQVAEEQLRQSQKLETLGRLTGGIAHDFNNILMVIMDGVESLTETGGAGPDAQQQLARIAQSAQRAEDLTRQMLAFSRRQPLRPRPTSINDLVAGTGKMLRRTLGEQIEIDSVLADDLWSVNIDYAQLEAALVKLCINARDAMPAGGRLMIETRNVTLDGDPAARGPGMPAGDCVQLTVSDTGCGIAPEVLDRIFEPFFTTKGEGRGSGLGLSTVYGFIRQSNGHIGVRSEVGQGTSFEILLPRHEGAAIQAAAATAPLAGGSERVLVVEDDPQVRASVVRQLQSLGYEVAQAADGSAGVAAFEAAARPYDLLLTDVVMPGPLNGKALADEVSRRWPGTRIVFMSGYTDNALVYRGQIDADVRLLNKPFRKSDLAKMIRQALDSETVRA